MICLNVYMSTVCMFGGHGSQKRTSDFLELELWIICMILSHNVGSENRTWVLDKKHLLLLTAKLSLQLYFKIFYLFIYLCRQIYIQVVVKKQLVGVSFPFLLCRSWGSDLILWLGGKCLSLPSHFITEVSCFYCWNCQNVFNLFSINSLLGPFSFFNCFKQYYSEWPHTLNTY